MFILYLYWNDRLVYPINISAWPGHPPPHPKLRDFFSEPSSFILSNPKVHPKNFSIFPKSSSWFSLAIRI